MIRAVLFDLDETLIDKTAAVLTFLPLQYQRFRLGEHGVEEQRYIAEFLQLEKAGLVRKRDLYPRLTETFGLPGDLAAALFHDFETVYPGMAVPMSGAKQTISTLKQYGVLIGVVSNGEANVQRPKIAAAGLNEVLDLVVISGDIGLRKPAREIFELAAGRLDLPVDNCLFVGDNPEADILGADNAGMHAVYFGPKNAWPASLPSPRYRIELLPQLIALVRDLNALTEGLMATKRPRRR
ncbi:HAD family hydrolase [Rhizobium laguerreae]|uniref:HAD family hydrolase n=1 Tax=Rhizobium laguerreae TaxID=1076926 RepID=UPI00143F0F09|nr:HAD family hydrolase [Rhizobium laguerreae]MBN9981844.1 HAD family hydrolase [Rhizobium laguerreae]MBY3069151.1 HAD family hydrolase [Rhizobium laguerreae]MBY3089385.1 HAD family hydrolase [Rhizobium laguerreae]MBY3098801.1 HAD family hydrolase [Rhizobium laguerreae]MBY3105868.1 HAD family hydrolase [Rhizobium laguerreae]